MAVKEKKVNFAFYDKKYHKIMDIEGKIILDLGIQSGTSKAGNPWKKREMVLETFGQYPRKVKFTIFGDARVDSLNLEVGKDYILSFDLESREFNGRWYTDVTIYRAQPIDRQMEGGYPPQQGAMGGYGAGAPSFAQPGPSYGQPEPPYSGGFEASGESDEDLPF